MTAGESEAQYEALHAVFHTSEMGLIVLDAAGKIRLWNDWMASTSQISSAMAQGFTIDAVFPELAGSRVCHAIQEALQHRRASLLSQTLHQAPFPLYRTAAQSRQRVPAHHRGPNRILRSAPSRSESRPGTPPLLNGNPSRKQST